MSLYIRLLLFFGRTQSGTLIFAYHLAWSSFSYILINLDPREGDPQLEAVKSQASCNYCGNISVWTYFFLK